MKTNDINDIDINAKLLENLYRFASLAKIELEDAKSVVNFSNPNHHWEIWGIDYCYDANKAVKLGWGKTKNDAMEAAVENAKTCAKNTLQQQIQEWLLNMGESPIPDFLEKTIVGGSTPSAYLEKFKQEYTAISENSTLAECQQTLDDMLMKYSNDILVLLPILDE